MGIAAFYSHKQFSISVVNQLFKFVFGKKCQVKLHVGNRNNRLFLSGEYAKNNTAKSVCKDRKRYRETIPSCLRNPVVNYTNFNIFHILH